MSYIKKQKDDGLRGIRTLVTRFKVWGANHYTMRPTPNKQILKL